MNVPERRVVMQKDIPNKKKYAIYYFKQEVHF